MRSAVRHLRIWSKRTNHVRLFTVETSTVEESVVSKIGAKHHELKSHYDKVAADFPNHR